MVFPHMYPPVWNWKIRPLMADILHFPLLQQKQLFLVIIIAQKSPLSFFGTGNLTHMLHCDAEDNGRIYPKASPIFIFAEYPKVWVAVLSVHSCLGEKKRKHLKKRYIKYLVRLVKIVQSVIATLDKTSKGKCTPYFFFPGKDISSCLIVYQELSTSLFTVMGFLFRGTTFITPLFVFCIFNILYGFPLALNKERNICSLREVPSVLSLVRRRRRTRLQCHGTEGAQITRLGETCPCKATPPAPSALPKTQLTPGQGTRRALHPHSR